MASNATYFGPPFDDEGADVILRSSATGDKGAVDFRVHKIILSIASPFFKQMFSLPKGSPSGESGEIFRDGLPVVVMSEPAPAIELVLRFLYPIPSPQVALVDVATLLEFSRKYEFSAYSQQIEERLRAMISWDAVGVYAISVVYGLPDIGRRAARATCRLSLTTLDSPLLDRMSIQQYKQLMATRIAAGNAVCDLAMGQSFYVATPGSSLVTHSAESGAPRFEWRCWSCNMQEGKWILSKAFKSYLNHVRTELRRGAGTNIILSSVDNFITADGAPCPDKTRLPNERCDRVTRGSLRFFAERLHLAVQDVCAKVRNALYWVSRTVYSRSLKAAVVAFP